MPPSAGGRLSSHSGLVPSVRHAQGQPCLATSSCAECALRAIAGGQRRKAGWLSGRVGDAGSAVGRLLVHGPEGIYAMSAVCTHLGCLTPGSRNWVLSRARAIGSKFTRAGVKIEGPAPHPLPWLRAWINEDGDLLIDRSEPLRSKAVREDLTWPIHSLNNSQTCATLASGARSFEAASGRPICTGHWLSSRTCSCTYPLSRSGNGSLSFRVTWFLGTLSLGTFLILVATGIPLMLVLPSFGATSLCRHEGPAVCGFRRGVPPQPAPLVGARDGAAGLRAPVQGVLPGRVPAAREFNWVIVWCC